MPEAAARSRMASRGKASDSSKRGTYLSSIAAVRTDRSPCKLARTSCAGGNAAACPNLCTYLRATQCSPARTIILSTSPGPASPSTERHRAPHALRAPSYLQEREREAAAARSRDSHRAPAPSTRAPLLCDHRVQQRGGGELPPQLELAREPQRRGELLALNQTPHESARVECRLERPAAHMLAREAQARPRLGAAPPEELLDARLPEISRA
mmetsp:Transcript_28349/g.83780  ORF Transcript_28349/g.83780 Transcript_28349/m.83780 type:complete len:212 (+) Transcript_28349:383-1018(+)